MVYMALFLIIFLGIFITMARQPDFIPRNIDLIQLERKIQNGEIRELKIKSGAIEAFDDQNRRYTSSASDESCKELISLAQEKGPDGRLRVAKIDENTVEPRAPVALSL